VNYKNELNDSYIARRSSYILKYFLLYFLVNDL
jgi:hypothetical protein